MQIGEAEFPLQVGITLIIFVLSIIFNIFLFIRGHQSYSIKYEIMLNDKNFRRHQWLTEFVQITYKAFFVLPFLLLILMVILQGMNRLNNIPIIVANGLVLLLITYPFKTNLYYIKEIIIWIFAIASQFIALFLQSQGSKVDYYTLLCTIFYPINCILFCLALLSREDKYWEIQKALTFPSVEERLKKIYPAFTQKEDVVIQIEERQRLRENHYFEETIIKEKTITKFINIPQIFNGGVFGTLCRERRGYKFSILYFLSVCILIINAVVIWKVSNSGLGWIGLITNIIYDLFIFCFNVLPTPERSIRNVFILVFLGRFLSFIFGQSLWIFGYCILYLFVGVFIGKILINNRLPLRNIRKQQASRKATNAFRTPEFVLFILSVQIFLLVLASSFGIGSASASVSYSQTVQVPLWQFAILVVIATWIIILYMASVRMYERNANSIKQKVEYYFGSKAIKEYHIYIMVTYLMIIGLGLYSNYALHNATALIACIFLPIIYIALIKFVIEWINNEYQMLADIPEYNRKVQKLNKVIEKKEKALKKPKKELKEEDGSGKELLVETNQVFIKNSTERAEAENSKFELVHKSETNSQNLSNISAGQQIQRLQSKKQSLRYLQDWRQFEGSMSFSQFWKCLTPSDKWLLVMVVILATLFIGFILCDYFISKSIFGIFIIICLVSLLSLMPFYRYCCTFKDFVITQYIWYEFGYVLGVCYWSAYHDQLAYTMIWAGIYFVALTLILSFGIMKKIQKSLIYWLLLNIGLTICFVCLFLGFTVPPFIAVIVSVVLILACIGAIPIAYVYIEGHLPIYIKVICGIFIGGGVVTLSIIGFVLDFASNFGIFTFIMICLYIILMIVGGAIFYQKQADKYENPHVYSAFGEPIYRFDSAAEQLKSSKNHKVLLDIGSVILVVYASAVDLIFTQNQWAIYALGLYCCTSFFQNILFALKTYEQLASNPSELTEELMLTTLEELDEKYMLDFKQNKYSEQLEKLKDQKKKEAQSIIDEDQLDAKWLEIAKLNSQCIKNREQQYKFFYFWIVLLQFHIFTKAKTKMVTFINQVKQIQDQLIELGIFLSSLSFAIDFATKYQLLTQQIDNLGPVDYLYFHQVLKRHQKSSSLTRQLQNKKGEDINNQQLQKQKKIVENLKEELGKSTNEKINEFNDMIKALGKKDLYEDTDFPHTNQSLGTLASNVEKWRRPTSKEVLIKGSISPYDVRQGNIGDCYLISSLGVLGDKWILPALGLQSQVKKKWVNQKGAYMVRFFKFSRQIFVVVDDYLPVDEHDQYVFAKSEEENEIWPCILEKAYAKLYGGYQNIVEGQCHRVFAELSGGVPFQILTKDYESNPNGIWQKILNSRANSYLMAAGSNSHELGDQACSKRNIVFGHAYSILDAKQVEGYKLMKLKNPHGSGGKEWNGDFSDTSQYMNDRMMQLLGHEKKDDGVFWMKLDDFMHEFRSLYICAIFDESVFKKFEIQGEFTLENSYGTPSKSEQTFRNPQYGITVNSKSTVFVNLTQKDTLSTFEGKNFIFMRIQKTNGKRVSKFNKNQGVCGLPQKSKNTVSVSMEVILEADSYPCTFTLYVSCADEGDTGQYKLDIYCTDKSAVLIPDKQFDRENF